MTYEETLQYIHSLGMFSQKASLFRITALLQKLGNPQNRCPAIHIAGTNGKGSTAVMTAAVLRAAGYKTGLFVSPFVIDFCERIQVDGDFIPRDDLVRLSEQVRSAGIAVTEFEHITAVGFLYFAAQCCDAVVIETGLGGRLDATNTMRDVRVSVIAKIGLDHTAILGDTIEKIAAEKCGIIRNNVTVTCSRQDESALPVIRAAAKELYLPDRRLLTVLRCNFLGNVFDYRGVRYQTALIGDFQIENALTAIETVRHSGFAVTDEQMVAGIAAARFPARMEIVSRQPLVVLDGAHNPDGAEVLRRAMLPYAGKITAVVGMMRDKNYEDFLAKTLPLCRRVIAVQATDSPRALTAEDMAFAARRHCADVVSADSPAAALSAAASADILFVFGSLYLASAIRPLLFAQYH